MLQAAQITELLLEDGSPFTRKQVNLQYRPYEHDGVWKWFWALLPAEGGAALVHGDETSRVLASMAARRKARELNVQITSVDTLKPGDDAAESAGVDDAANVIGNYVGGVEAEQMERHDLLDAIVKTLTLAVLNRCHATGPHSEEQVDANISGMLEYYLQTNDLDIVCYKSEYYYIFDSVKRNVIDSLKREGLSRVTSWTARNPTLESAPIQEAKRPSQKALKDNRVALDPEERKLVMRRKAVWHHGPGGNASPAIWKSVVNGKTYYGCNTHRAIQVKNNLKAAIRAFAFIKTTA